MNISGPSRPTHGEGAPQEDELEGNKRIRKEDTPDSLVEDATGKRHKASSLQAKDSPQIEKVEKAAQASKREREEEPDDNKRVPKAVKPANKERDDLQRSTRMASFVRGLTKDEAGAIESLISSLPRGERCDELLLHAQQDLPETSTGLERFFIIAAYARIPKRDSSLRDAVIKTLQLKILRDKSDVASCLRLIGQMPNSERADFAKHLLHMIQLAARYKLDIHRLLSDTSMIPPIVREFVLSEANIVLEKNQFNVIWEIVTYIGRIPDDQKGEVVDNIRKFVEGHREHLSDIVLVINAITSIPLKQWNDLLEIEKPYFNKFLDVTFQAMYLYALSRVPVEQRKEALTRAKPFMPTILPENAHDFTSQIQSLLLTTSASDWDKRLSAALPYFDKEDPLYYKLGIINAVLGVSDEERKDVLSRALPLVKKDKVWGCTEKYINAIAKIPADQRAAILAQVELIIGSGGIPEEDEFTRDYYIDEISSLPSVPRNALFERISQRLEAATSYSARHDIFEREMNELLPQLGYAIHIARSELEKKPIQILENVTSRFSQGAQYALFIRFQDEAGIDASGLSKEFITLLFAGIVDALHFEKYENGLYLPKLPMSSEDALAYENLGKLMMFCLNAIKEYPIGMIFDRSVFVALTNLKPEHLDKPFESLIADQNIFQELVDIYAKMNSRTRQESEDMNKLKSYAAPFTSETDVTTLKDSFSAFGLDYDEDFINKGITIDTIQVHLAEVQQAVRREITNKYLIPHLRDYLLPLIEIAKGMRRTPFRRVSMDDVQMMGPDRLSEKLQGQISKEMVISKLRFVNIPDHKQQWVKEWISNTDTESLKTFVFGMTGAKAIGTKGLTICSANTIFYQTCYNRLTLPFGLIDNQQECNKMLNNSLEDIKGYTIA